MTILVSARCQLTSIDRVPIPKHLDVGSVEHLNPKAKRTEILQVFFPPVPIWPSIDIADADDVTAVAVAEDVPMTVIMLDISIMEFEARLDQKKREQNDTPMGAEQDVKGRSCITSVDCVARL